MEKKRERIERGKTRKREREITNVIEEKVME